MGKRENEVTLLFGARNTGKTTHVHEMIAKVRKTKPQLKIVVMDTFDSEPYRVKYPEKYGEEFKTVNARELVEAGPGLYRMYGSNFPLMFKALDMLYNTFVVMEDAKKYLGSNIPKNVLRTIIDTKQKNVDLLILFHSVMHAAPDLWSLADKVILHKCAPVKQRLNLVGDPVEFQKTYEQVMASKNRYVWKEIRIN